MSLIDRVLRRREWARQDRIMGPIGLCPPPPRFVSWTETGIAGPMRMIFDDDTPLCCCPEWMNCTCNRRVEEA